jgi:hypothetical protein
VNGGKEKERSKIKALMMGKSSERSEIRTLRKGKSG